MKRLNGKQLLRENWALCLALLVVFALHMWALRTLGVHHGLQNDDLSYLESGLTFAKTGVVSMHSTYPSAQIMPGMTYLIAFASLIFGDGVWLWAALKMLWAIFGTCTALFVYRSVHLFAPKWCGIAAMLPLLRADMIWMDNLLLTETPFMLALTVMVYYTLRMGQEANWKNFWCCAAGYLAALLLKANIAPYPVLALTYLLLRHYDRKLLGKQCIALAAVVLCFILPWSVRNYLQFHAFIPLTYGAGNPTLLGTYQGEGYPADEELDYVKFASTPVRKDYAEYFDENGEVKPQYALYISLQEDAYKAKYRQKVWFAQAPGKMLRSYLLEKPWRVIRGVFYWNTPFSVTMQQLQAVQYVDLALCGLAVLCALLRRRLRGVTCFVTLVYLANVYIYSMTFAYERYNASLMSLRFILVGLALAQLQALLRGGIASRWTRCLRGQAQ